MMSNKVALVTGSNKGIGLAIVEELCRRGVGLVYLASRDRKRGEDAVKKLNQKGFYPTLIELEITDGESVKKAAEVISDTVGGLDILVTNAAVGPDDFNKTTYEDSKRVINVNYRSAHIIEEFLYPIMNENSRVISISSDCGHISNLRNKSWIHKLTRDNVTVKEVDAFVDWFLESVKNNTLKVEDFAVTNLLAYRVSKVALMALSKIQQRKIDRNIAINSIHPGFVQTDMTSGQGFLTVDQAAKAPVYLALDVPQDVKGAYYWYDKKARDWADPRQELHTNTVNLLEI